MEEGERSGPFPGTLVLIQRCARPCSHPWRVIMRPWRQLVFSIVCHTALRFVYGQCPESGGVFAGGQGPVILGITFTGSV